MLTSGPVLQTIRQKSSGVQAFRDLARRYNQRSQARSLAQLQEIMHFDFGQEPAGVTDRMIVFERLVGECETSSGEALGEQVKCAVLLERVPPELRSHLLLTCGSRPDCAIMRQTVESNSVARWSWQPSHSTPMGERPMEIDAVYGDRGKKGKHAKGKKGKDKGGTAQSTTGLISTLMEDHAHSGWLCELVVGSDDARMRKCEFVELLVDTGATEHVCGPRDFTHAALTNGPHPALKTATGELLKH